MSYYSFIMDFRGGTYIEQVEAPNLEQALTIWAETLDVKAIKYLNIKTKNQLIADLPELIQDKEFTPIDSVSNIWLGCYLFKTGFARIHIFKTDTTPEQVEI